MLWHHRTRPRTIFDSPESERGSRTFHPSKSWLKSSCALRVPIPSGDAHLWYQRPSRDSVLAVFSSSMFIFLITDRVGGRAFTLPRRLVILSSPVCSPLRISALMHMPGSPTVERRLNDELTRVGRVSTQQEAQEFADVVSDVYRPPLGHAIYDI
ncbi:hypothetical protein BDM02DRAFT_3112293 [Thelephora ganbajun]|uniref:Uncharacterized protein n=1 Tax=Thelephora ganbajun TaxID=370292 RepID=A0ACB6ZLB9_THEGA|nr:hypothetical protein BDM02DRAFT_3112293 [Thelephora ganbajun]